MFTLFAVVSLICNWYKRTSRYHSRALHRVNYGVRDTTWVGEISDVMRKRVEAKLHGDRIYTLTVGSYHRGMA